MRFDSGTLTQLDCMAGAHQHTISAMGNTGDHVLSASRERLVMWDEVSSAAANGRPQIHTRQLYTNACTYAYMHFNMQTKPNMIEGKAIMLIVFVVCACP